MLQCLTELTAKTICCTQNALPLQKPTLQRLIITRRKILRNKDKYYTCTSDYCKAANFDEGFYVLDNYGNNDFELMFIRGNEVFDVNITQTNINDENLLKQLKI